MRKPTRLLRGEGRRRWGSRAIHAPSGSAGVVATACMYREMHATREARHGGGRDLQPDSREGQAGLCRVAERPVVCAGQRMSREGLSPSDARMRSVISKSGGNASLAGEHE
jgi:hypothetical protein